MLNSSNCVWLHVDNPANKKPVEIEKPNLPAGPDQQPGERAEPPQIKGPVEVPERKKEEVQLDRPHAGMQSNAVLLNFRSSAMCD